MCSKWKCTHRLKIILCGCWNCCTCRDCRAGAALKWHGFLSCTTTESKFWVRSHHEGLCSSSRRSVCFSPVESHKVFVSYPALLLPFFGKHLYFWPCLVNIPLISHDNSMFLGTCSMRATALELLSGWIHVQVQGTAHWSPGSVWIVMMDDHGLVYGKNDRKP